MTALVVEDLPGLMSLHVLPNEITGCWEWTGATNDERKKYGVTSVDGQRWLTHRAAYAYLVGPIPEGYEVDHKCRSTRCCNPLHLEAVDPDENKRRSPLGSHGKDRCRNGHQLVGDNLYVHPRGERVCKTCRADAHRRHRERQAARKAA